LIILGAGPSLGKGRPLGLQKVTLERRVLDWQLDAFSMLVPEVSFVGGYDIAQVMQSFPRLDYFFNADWQITGSVASLALALESLGELARGERDLYIAYSDILLRPELVQSLASAPADRCATVVDTLHLARTDRAPETLHVDGALHEFVGLIRVPAACAEVFCREVLARAPKLRTAHMSALVSQMSMSSGLMQFVPVAAAGQWAHAEHGRSVAHFVLGSKAVTLNRLQKVVSLSRILPLFYFTRDAYRRERDTLLISLLNQFGQERRLIVRSSAADEDGFETANAGRYRSEMNVRPERIHLGNAIDQVFASYGGDDPLDEVLVQPQLDQVRASGVMFTRALKTGAPYRVINYTLGSDTTAITAGLSRDGVKLYVSRTATASALSRLPAYGQRLIAAADEIETLVCHDALDIEFAIDSEDRLVTLQVRPLMVDDAYQDRYTDDEVGDCLKGLHALLEELGQAPSGQVGAAAAWSVMADWNPAEIIGLTPGPLALDLYRRIVTDTTWALQRHQVGYRDLRNWPLIRSFGGQTFVDVRASVNSFVPACLPDDLANRLVNHAMNLLIENRALHDKLEFELLPTCLDFGFDDWRADYRVAGVADEADLAALEAGLRMVTRNIIERTTADVAAACALELRCERLEARAVPSGDWLRRTLDVCAADGALPFAHLARAGFVAAALLRSAVRKGLVSDARRAALMEDISGVGRMLTDAALAVREGHMTRDAFVKRFGHLRPGTYDISTPAYRDRPADYLDPIIETAIAHIDIEFAWTAEEQAALNIELAKLDIGLDAQGLHEFAKTAIAGREYAKFVFTRLLSAALDALATRGLAAGIAADKLDCMPLNGWLDESILSWGAVGNCSEIAARTAIRYRQHALASRIHLPPVLMHPDEVFAFEVPPSEPSFITARHARAKLIIVESGEVMRRETVKDCVVAILNADPGFDYLFALGITGLITAFGGPNSHMAIRASEFSIPAVIGIGEQAFLSLRSGSVVSVDGQRRRWQQEGGVCVS
jgi:phosphohistidine swiveling domain-containing protein